MANPMIEGVDTARFLMRFNECAEAVARGEYTPSVEQLQDLERRCVSLGLHKEASRVRRWLGLVDPYVPPPVLLDEGDT